MIKTKISTKIIVKVLRDGVVIDELPEQKNLILRGVMDSIKDLGVYLHVGTGSAIPDFNDTSLSNFLKSSPASSWSEQASILNGSVYEKEVVNTFTFAVGDVVGNISELGVASLSSQVNDLHTRALFKDGAGDPTTITVTAQDQLVVTYFVKKHISMTPTSESLLVDGITINYTLRPCITTVGDSGSSARVPSTIYQSLTNDNLYMTVQNTNRISVDPVTFLVTELDGGGDTSPEGSHSVTLTGTGNEVIHTFTYPITTGNFQWICATFSILVGLQTNRILFQIEFDGPNYITKENNQTVQFDLKEIVSQVL